MEKSIFLNKTNIVVSITDSQSLDEICKTKETSSFDVVEIRLDQLIKEPNLKNKISRIRHPLLLTCRHPDEGGQNQIQDPIKRHSILEPLLCYASAIDIELAEADSMLKIISQAKKNDLKVILSYHNFKTTPTPAELRSKIKESLIREADAIKFATTTNTISELINLLTLLENSKDQNISIMGMGKYGKASRLIAAQSGSILNYAAMGSSKVDGQWKLTEFTQAIK